MAEDCRGAGIDASMSLSSPTPGSPLPWTPTNGTLNLPEIGLTPGDDDEEYGKLGSVTEEPVQRIPKSNSNLDLRAAAATPQQSRGLGREFILVGVEAEADDRNPTSRCPQCPISPRFTSYFASQFTSCGFTKRLHSSQPINVSLR